MKNSVLILIVLVVGVGFMVFQAGSTPDAAPAPNSEVMATVYKSPNCGCCGVYASYMERQGYEIHTKNVPDMSVIKRELSIPFELESCHTMEIGGYVVEGHIPEEAVARLLAERPDIKGIGMPGMPSGSPGMPGPKTEDFVIYEITHDGMRGDIFMTI